MNEGAPRESLEKIEQIADETISSLDPNMNASIEDRTIMPFIGSEYDATVLKFSDQADSSKDWTMEFNRDSDYVEEKLPNVIKKSYEERDEKRNSAENQTGEEFEELFLNNQSEHSEEDAINEVRANIDNIFSQNSPKVSSPSSTVSSGPGIIASLGLEKW